MLIATHDLTFVAEVCPRYILLKESKLFADGQAEDLLYNKELMESADVEAIGGPNS